ncbi:VaFE repeat-containing surface-anchored protein [Peptoniphilaceae bacterium SGI.131]
MKFYKSSRKLLSFFLSLALILPIISGTFTMVKAAGYNGGYVANQKSQKVSLAIPYEGKNEAIITKDFIITHPDYKDFSVDAYCMNLSALWPDGSGKWTLHDEVNSTTEFSKFLQANGKPNRPRYADNNEMKLAFSWIAWAGHPLDAMGLKEKYGLDDNMFKNVTQVAIWYFSDSMLTKGGDTYGYLNESAVRTEDETAWPSISYRTLSDNEKNAIKELTLNGMKPSESNILTPELRQNFNDIKFGVYTNSASGYQNMFTSRWSPTPVKLQVAKVDENGTALLGASLKLTKLDAPKIKISADAYPNLSEDGQNVLQNWNSSGESQNWILTRGKYKLEEVSAPAGYSKLGAVEFEVKIDGSIVYKEGTLQAVKDAYKLERYADTFELVKGQYEPETVFNEKITVTNFGPNKELITFSKTAVNGSGELEGAKLKVLKGEGTGGAEVASWTSTKEQKTISLEKNQIYTMVETTAPQGYEVAENIVFKVTSEGKIQIKENGAFVDKDKALVQMKDSASAGSFEVKVSKVGLGGQELSGARILVTKKDDPNVRVAWTSGTSEKIISLKPGEYILHEEAAPSGYKVVTDIEFKVDEKGQLSILNTNTTGEAKLVEGKLVVTDRVYKENVSGDGNSPKLSTTVKANNSTATANTSATLKAEEAGSALISDRINYSGLVPGKAYTVTGSLYEVANGVTVGDLKANIVSTFIASSTGEGQWTLNFGRVNGIEVNKNYVVYEKAESNENLVDVDGNGTADEKQVIKHEDPNDVSQTIAVGNPVTSKNEEITFSKTAVNETKELPGAKLKVVKGDKVNGTLVQEWTSTTVQRKIVLEKGQTYTMIETTAPDGYEVAENIVFQVTEEGKLLIKGKDGSFNENVDKLVQMQDAPKTTSVVEKTITVSKVNLAGNELSGASIEIKRGSELVASWISEAGKNKEIKLKSGDYTLHEVAAPSGYKVVTDINFSISKDGVVTLTGANTSGQVKFENGKLIIMDNAYPTSVDGDSKSPNLATTVRANQVQASSNSEAAISKLDADKGANVVDTIVYKNLIGGEKYLVTGKLYEVKNAAVAGQAVKTITVEQTAAASGQGEWTIDFGNITGLKEGSSYVVYESASSVTKLVDSNNDGKAEESQVVKHEDPSDKSQTITVKTFENPTNNLELATRVKAGNSVASSENIASLTAKEAQQGVNVVDSVEYRGLVEGKTYTVTGKLYEVADGNIVGEAKATKTQTFIAAKGGEGSWDIDFGKVEGLEASKRYVVYEKAESLENLVDSNGDGTADTKQSAKHEDAKDKSQTFTVLAKEKEPVGEGKLETTVQARNSLAASDEAAKISETEAKLEEGVQVYDYVDYSGLVKDKVYKVTSKLYKVENGNTVGEALLTKEVRLKAVGESGRWVIDLGNSKNLEVSASYVVYERAVSEEKLIDKDKDGKADEVQEVIHENPNDLSQTFTVVPNNPVPDEPEAPVPLIPEETADKKLVTSLKANETVATADKVAQVSELAANDGVKISDTIKYEGLIGGKKYLVTGSLYRIENGVAVGGAIVRNTVEMEADQSGKGSWELELGKTDKLKSGVSYVIFEEAASVDNLVDVDNDGVADRPHLAIHEDPNDLSQIVTVKPEDPAPFEPVDPTPEEPEKPNPEEPEKPNPEEPEKPNPNEPEKPNPDEPKKPNPNEPVIPGGETPKGDNPNNYGNNNPKTGDSFNMTYPIGVLALAVLAYIGLKSGKLEYDDVK